RMSNERDKSEKDFNQVHIVGLRRTIAQTWQTTTQTNSKVSKGYGWTCENQYLILREWKKDIHASHQDLEELDFWAQECNVPIHWILVDFGLKIERDFKQVKDVVVPQGGNLAGKCLRLIVTVDLTQLILRCTNIQLGSRKITVEFNGPTYATIVGTLDIWTENCGKRGSYIISVNLTEGRYGDWMKLESPIFPINHEQEPKSSTSDLPTQNKTINNPSTSKNLVEIQEPISQNQPKKLTPQISIPLTVINPPLEVSSTQIIGEITTTYLPEPTLIKPVHHFAELLSVVVNPNK
ncbi:RNA binding, partial [Striga asiatica]